MFWVQCDKEEREGIAENPSQLDAYCRENGFTSWVECSAKANMGIDEAIKKLVTEVSVLFYYIIVS